MRISNRDECWGQNSPYMHQWMVRTVSDRPDALITETWAVMQQMGETYVARSPSPFAQLTSIHHRSGYHRSAKDSTTATREIIHGTRAETPELYTLGNPPVFVVAFGANVLKAGGTISRKGWHFAALRRPAAVHISVRVRAFPSIRDDPSLIVFSTLPSHRS